MRMERKANMAIAELDNKLKYIDLKSIINIKEIRLDILTEIDNIKGWKHLLQLKTEPQSIQIVK